MNNWILALLYIAAVSTGLYAANLLADVSVVLIASGVLASLSAAALTKLKDDALHKLPCLKVPCREKSGSSIGRPSHFAIAMLLSGLHPNEVGIKRCLYCDFRDALARRFQVVFYRASGIRVVVFATKMTKL